jgi:hypothetical protein
MKNSSRTPTPEEIPFVAYSTLGKCGEKQPGI